LYYWREDVVDDDGRTQRLDAHPRLYLPFQLKPFFTIEPSLGLRGTLWYLDKKKYDLDGDQKLHSRGLYDTRVDFFTEFFNVFRIEGKSMEAVKHSVRPRVVHTYIPDIDQDDLPNFDSIDRINNAHLLTYSLTNTLTSKTRKEGSFEITRLSDKDEATIIDSATDYSYNDFLRFELEQTYDIREAKQKDSETPFSPLAARLDFFPGKYIAMDADALFSVYDYEFISHNIGGRLWDGRGDKLKVEYRYTRTSDEVDLNTAKTLYGDIEIKVTNRLKVSGLYEYNFLDNTQVQRGLGFNYKADCWAIKSRVIEKTNVGSENDLNWELSINLFGLGEFGI
jgi:LPS-assembly protein